MTRPGPQDGSGERRAAHPRASGSTRDGAPTCVSGMRRLPPAAGEADPRAKVGPAAAQPRTPTSGASSAAPACLPITGTCSSSTSAAALRLRDVLVGALGRGRTSARRRPRPTGSTDFELPDDAWASFRIPIGLAFFMRTGETPARVVAFYPSPAGATESEIDADALARAARS